jgi:methionine-S-sulfoxide reductase
MKTATVLLGAGCFWGVQAYFDQVPGVIETTVGYSGGHVANPTYEMVCSHTTGHAEVTKVEFDPEKISYADILRQFFRMHDPTQLNRQGPDVGDSYRTAIFYFDDAQRETAEKVKAEQQAKFDKPIVTEITKAGPFYEAEDYHQKFFEKTGRGACHVPYAPIGQNS